MGTSNAPVRLLDEKRKAAEKLGLHSIPHLLIVDKKGIVKFAGVLIEEKQIVAEIEKVMNSSLP